MIEEKKTVFNYFSQTLTIFGAIMVIFMVFLLIVPEEAREVSSLYRLGKEGLSLATMAQLLLLSIIVTTVSGIFMTDRFIKRMSVPLRIALLFTSVVAAVVVMVIVFAWFPVDKTEAWVAFIICFVVSAAVSYLITRLKERAENNKMQEALEKYKKK